MYGKHSSCFKFDPLERKYVHKSDSSGIVGHAERRLYGHTTHTVEIACRESDI